MQSSEALLHTLKNVLRVKSIPYSKLAEKLNLSETSVKRLMSGHTPMTLDRLDQICELVGLEFFELLKLARPTERSDSAQLSIEQEQALADDIDLFLTFYALIKGLTAAEVVEKYKITAARMQKALIQLDRLGLILLMPENRVKFLVPRSVRWNERGPLSLKYEFEMQIDFMSGNFIESQDFRKFLTFPASDRSKQMFTRKLRELLNDMQSQSEVDVALEKNLKSTATIFIGLREWTPSLLNKYKR